VAVAFALFDSQLAWAQEQLIHSRTQKIQSKLGIPMHVDHKENATRPITMTRTHNNNCLQSPSPSKTLLRQSKDQEIITDRIEGLISQEKSATYVINDYLRNFEANVSEPVDASCRTKMIEWLYICVTALKLRRRVVPIAFSYVDRLLSLKDDSDISKDILQDRSKYQLLIIVCLYIAVKLNEPEVLSPQILSQLCQGRYTEQDIEEEELRVLGALNWRLTGPTALEYVLHFLALDIMPGSRSHVETAAVLNAISRTQAELSVSDQSLVSVPYFVLALASIRNAMEDFAYYTPQEWSESLEKLSAIIDIDPFAHEVDEAMVSLRRLERDSALGTAFSVLSSDLICHSPTRHKVSRAALSPNSVSHIVSVKSCR